MISDTEKLIDLYLNKNQFFDLEKLCELAIEEDGQNISNYWYLALANLLNQKEEEAQAIWLYSISLNDLENVDKLSQSLILFLANEAERQEKLSNIQNTWLIRQHIRTLQPSFLDNLLKLISTSISLKYFTPENIEEWDVIPHLTSNKENINEKLCLETLEKLLEYPHPNTLEFSKFCLSNLKDSKSASKSMMSAAIKANQEYLIPKYSADLTELCLEADSNNFHILNQLPRFYLRSKEYQSAIKSAKRLLSQCHTDEEKAIGDVLLLKSYLCAGEWKEIEEIAERYKKTLQTIIESNRKDFSLPFLQFLIGNTALLQYIYDDVETNRYFQNSLSLIFQKCIENIKNNHFQVTHNPTKELIEGKKIKIGYIAHTLSKHSVGWLSRWLFKYHNRNKFHISLYLINQSSEDEFAKEWFYQKVDSVIQCENDIIKVAKNIKDSHIDILVDLDSITLDFTCSVMALKPAPIQVTWLGWDASGIPAIDYYLADKNVIPETETNFYTEKVWHLPGSYIAVDGFEVGVADINRDILQIPCDSIIYFSAQTGFKRHPKIANAQVNILKNVSNSYLLIKGLSDQESIKEQFVNLANEAGLNPDRIKFLPITKNEETHRANIRIADVVLDTYPYNGATTTLETLWMEVPIVTLVGRQMPARNSYAFLKTLGICEGIAHSYKDYENWGIELGNNKKLRQDISQRLRDSKKGSSLWNTKLFTKKIEDTFESMMHEIHH